PARRVTEVHCLAYRASPGPKSTNLVATTRRFRGTAADGGERYERRDWVAAPFKYPNCGSWVRLAGGSALLDCRQPGRRAPIDPTRWPLSLYSRSDVRLGTPYPHKGPGG